MLETRTSEDLAKLWYASMPGYSRSSRFVDVRRNVIAAAPSVGIRNIRLADSSVSGRYFVGGIIGRGGNNTIYRADSYATVRGTGIVGGIAGWHSGRLERSRNFGGVVGAESVGGLIGVFSPQSATDVFNIVQSANTGVIFGYYGVGGLVGSATEHAVIRDSYNTGRFGTGNRDDFHVNNFGGLIGSIFPDSSFPTPNPTIVNSYNAGRLRVAPGVSPPDFAGAIIGYAGSYSGGVTASAFISNAYYLSGSLDVFPDVAVQAASWNSPFHFRFLGNPVHAGVLKNLTPGPAFVINNTSFNNGFPILAWELEYLN